MALAVEGPAAVAWHWYGIGMALVRHWYGIGMALVWPWYGIGRSFGTGKGSIARMHSSRADMSRCLQHHHKRKNSSTVAHRSSQGAATIQGAAKSQKASRGQSL
eukprot:364207-Chlamydomonas_euryale.AAC.15